MIDILDCTLKRAVELASHFMNPNTQFEIFKDGRCTGIKTLADLETHSRIYECMSDDYGHIDRVEVYNSAVAVHIQSY